MTSTKEYVQRDDGFRRANRKKNNRRCRKRLSILLHTHVALILVCSLAALDSACVIGQIICDILIMKETLHEWEVLDKNLTTLLVQEMPLLNATGHDDPANLNLENIRDIIVKHQNNPQSNLSLLSSQLASSGIVLPNGGEMDPKWVEALQKMAAKAVQPGSGSSNDSLSDGTGSGNETVGEVIIGFFKIPVSHSRSRRAGGGDTGEHGLLHDLTHSFHLGSMIILSILLLETLLKVFAMGKKVLNHKLEMFDAFVVSVSWALDIAFWEGIWAHPGTEAATILIFILPWRVVRIVNSFVLVIQEKDHVQLKIVKQRLRLSMKKSKESVRKASSYRTEVKQLQGLCRKYGAVENEINACGPTGRSGRRRSSLMPAMERAASLTLISALGSHPSLYTMDSSSDEDDAASRDLEQQDRTLRSAFSVTTLDSVFTIDGKRSSFGDGYMTSDNELDNESTAGGLDNPVFSVEGEEDNNNSSSNNNNNSTLSNNNNDTNHVTSTPVLPAGGEDEAGEARTKKKKHHHHHHHRHHHDSNSHHHHRHSQHEATEAADPASPTSVEEGGEAGNGRRKLARRLHERLSEQPSVVSVTSEMSTTSSTGADVTAQEVPPRYHEVVSKQDSNTRL